MRKEMRRPNCSWRVDETYVRVAGKWTYLYRAIDSAGDTFDFLLSPNRDLIAAKAFLRRAVNAGRVREQEGRLSHRCRCRSSPCMNNIIQQDHRFEKSG